MKPFELEDYRDLFLNEDSFNQFANGLKKSFANNMNPILLGDEVVGSTLSLDATKEHIANFMPDRMGEWEKILKDSEK